VLKDIPNEKDHHEGMKDVKREEVIAIEVLREDEVALHAEMTEREAVEVIEEEAGAGTGTAEDLAPEALKEVALTPGIMKAISQWISLPHIIQKRPTTFTTKLTSFQ
jgi:hypothetical protein